MLQVLFSVMHISYQKFKGEKPIYYICPHIYHFCCSFLLSRISNYFGIISLPPVKFILALTLVQVYWQLIILVFLQLRMSLFHLYSKKLLISLLLDLELWAFERLKNVIPLPSGLHGFWTEICSHSHYWSFTSDVRFPAWFTIFFFSLVFSTLVMICVSEFIWLRLQCSCRRIWAHILLFCHPETISLDLPFVVCGFNICSVHKLFAVLFRYILCECHPGASWGPGWSTTPKVQFSK